VRRVIVCDNVDGAAFNVRATDHLDAPPSTSCADWSICWRVGALCGTVDCPHGAAAAQR